MVGFDKLINPANTRLLEVDLNNPTSGIEGTLILTIKHNTTKGITITPITIHIQPRKITPAIIHQALQNALQEETPSQALQALTQTIANQLTTDTSFTLPNNTPITQAIQTCTHQYNKLPVQLDTTGLQETLLITAQQYDTGLIPENGEQHYALCLQGIPDQTKKCYGKYIDEKITQEMLGGQTLTRYFGACMSGVVACELMLRGTALGPAGVLAAATLGVGEGALVCGLPSLMANSVKDKIVENAKKTGEATYLRTPPLGYYTSTLGIGVLYGATKYQLLMRSPGFPISRAMAVLEAYSGKKKLGPFAGIQKKAAEEVVKNYVENMSAYLPEGALPAGEGKLLENAKLLMKLKPEDYQILYAAKQAGIKGNQAKSLVKALASGSKEKLEKTLKELLKDPAFRRAFLGKEVEQSIRVLSLSEVLTNEKIEELAEKLAREKYGLSIYSEEYERLKANYRTQLRNLRSEAPEDAAEKLRQMGLEDIADSVESRISSLTREATDVMEVALIEGEEAAGRLLQGKELPPTLKELLGRRIGTIIRKLPKPIQDAMKLAAETSVKTELLKATLCSGVGFAAGTTAAALTTDIFHDIQKLQITVTDENKLIITSPGKTITMGGVGT